MNAWKSVAAVHGGWLTLSAAVRSSNLLASWGERMGRLECEGEALGGCDWRLWMWGRWPEQIQDRTKTSRTSRPPFEPPLNNHSRSCHFSPSYLREYILILRRWYRYTRPARFVCVTQNRGHNFYLISLLSEC